MRRKRATERRSVNRKELTDYRGANAFCYEAGAGETGCHCLAGSCRDCAACNEALLVLVEMLSMI